MPTKAKKKRGRPMKDSRVTGKHLDEQMKIQAEKRAQRDETERRIPRHPPETESQNVSAETQKESHEPGIDSTGDIGHKDPKEPDPNQSTAVASGVQVAKAEKEKAPKQPHAMIAAFQAGQVPGNLQDINGLFVALAKAIDDAVPDGEPHDEKDRALSYLLSARDSTIRACEGK